MKIITIILSFVFSISLISLCKMSFDYFSMDYKKTNAVITNIISPDGIVYGEFWDNEGVFHSDVEMYIDYQGHESDISSHIGEEVTILYDIQENECMNYSSFVSTLLFFIFLCLFSGIFLVIMFLMIRKKKNKKT